jgi:hypothetical protein
MVLMPISKKDDADFFNLQLISHRFSRNRFYDQIIRNFFLLTPRPNSFIRDKEVSWAVYKAFSLRSA